MTGNNSMFSLLDKEPIINTNTGNLSLSTHLVNAAKSSDSDR